MRPESIKNKIEFNRVFEKGKRYNGEFLALIVEKGSGTLKLGIIVNSKFGGAVERNRVKRKIREAFRSVAGKFKENPEIVIIPKGPAREAKTSEILTDLSTITHTAGIL